MSSSTDTGKSSQFRHIQFESAPAEKLNPLLERQLVTGDRSMLARIILSKGCIVPEHSHENEQITYVLKGILRFTIQGQQVDVRAGDVLVIPSLVPHSAEALEDTIDLDIFCPPRADWLDGTDAYLRR